MSLPTDGNSSTGGDAPDGDSPNRDISNGGVPDGDVPDGGVPDDPDGGEAPRTDASGGDAPKSASPGSDPPGGDDPAGAGPETPLSTEEWTLVRAPFSRTAYVVESRAVGRTSPGVPGEEGPNQAVVDLRLRPEAIRDRLDWALGPGRYAYRFEPGPEESGPYSVFCHLRIGAGARTGIGSASRLRVAQKVALADAAAAFGIGASGQAAGPIGADHESWYEVPDSVLEALERRRAPAPWTPDNAPPDGETPPGETSPGEASREET